MAILSAKEINKKYGKQTVLQNMSFSIGEQDFISITGRSGSGKTTLLHILCFLETYDSGEIYYHNRRLDLNNYRDIARIRKENFALIVQDFALIYTLNIYENIELPLLSLRFDRKTRKKKVTEIAKQIGIYHLLDKYPDELSGGECQKVAICRAIIKNPKILLADEPTGSLDQKSEEHIMEILHWLNNKGMTIILVTHNLEIAKQCKKTYDIESLQQLG